MRLTIRPKLLIANGIVLLVIFGGMTIYLVRTDTHTLRANLQNEAKSFATLATTPVADTYNIYAESGTDQIRAAMANYLALSKNITNISIVDVSGTELFAYSPSSAPHVTATQASSFVPVYATQGGELQYVVDPYLSTAGAHPFNVVYSVSNTQINSELHREVVSLVVFGTLLLLLTGSLTYFLINRIVIKPIREVSRQAGVISGGNLEQQINVHGHDEVAALGSAVNTMAESLKGSIAKLQEIDKVKSEFMAITSHNLRTPLTIINGYLESLDSFDSVDKLKQALRRIGDSVKRLGSFAEDVLTISSIELGEHASRDTFKIGDFIQKVIDQTRTSAQLQKLKLVTDLQTNAEVNASEPYLRNAVWNLIDNALKFTPEGGTITIATKEDAGAVHISVTDTGIGITASEMPKLFTKFHRATSVIKYDYEGTGIGLYASKIIVEQQGGSIQAQSEEGRGSTFTISLPLAGSQQTEPQS